MIPRLLSRSPLSTKILPALAALAALCPLGASAQGDLVKPDRTSPTHISPYYFGPNAFPPPEMLDGSVCHDLRLELYGDYYRGFAGDYTADISLKVKVPLFTDRVNLTLWWPVMEWWSYTDKRLQQIHLTPENREKGRSGSVSGDIYLTTDILILKEKKYRPGWTVRAGLRTAAGGKYYYARYYDSPGYFFDTSIGKSFHLGGLGNHSLRGAISTGFLCWQTGDARQNDAVMYGALLRWTNDWFRLTGRLEGYAGWESSHGASAKDCPMTVSADLARNIRQFEIFGGFQYGLKDYPYWRLRLGLAYNIDILSKKSKKSKK